jgi:hypothetical protein
MRIVTKDMFSFLVPASVVFMIVFLMPAVSFGYVGPGLGAGTVGVVLGAIASVFLALFAVIWYPIKRLIKKIRGTKKAR